jgi:hypothetical protein
MKKFILTLIIAFMMIFTANAQIATENTKLFDNTYVGVEAGITSPLNFNSMFPINTVIGVKLGKELTPSFAIEGECFTSFGNNVYRYGYNGSIPAKGMFNVHKNGSTNTAFKSTNIGLNGVINWSNLLFGYQGTPRFFEIKTNTGFGWLHYFGKYTADMPIGGYTTVSKNNALTAKTSVDLAFNLDNKKAHTITVSPGIYWDLNETNNIKFDKNYAQFAIMLGYTYHFKTSNGTHHFKTYDVGAMIDEISRLNDELAKKPNEVVVEKIVKVDNITTVPFAVTDAYVFFAYDSAELDARAKGELDKLGENGVYDIVAFASNEGTAEYNKALSQRRADAVKAYLEGRGCKINSAEGKGVAFGITTGRVAVVTSK